MTLTQIFQANGLFFSIVFGLLSLVSLTLIVWKAWLNHSARCDLDQLVGAAEKELPASGVDGALRVCRDEPGLVPKLFVTALETAPQGKVATRDAIANRIELDLIPDLNFLLPLMLVLAKLSPMLGLLGTVWGMIQAFGKIAGSTKVEPSALANDIGMALFTTAEGLIIAIPLIFAYTMFREWANRFELELQRGAQAALVLSQKAVGRA